MSDPADPNWKPTKEQLVQSEYADSRHDNIWETTPKATAEFFAKCKKPFVAYKVLAAGAIHPRLAFQWAFESGADFICIGMFDFQVVENTGIGVFQPERLDSVAACGWRAEKGWYSWPTGRPRALSVWAAWVRKRVGPTK